MVSEDVAHDEFRLDLEDGWIHIIDEEGSVHLSMPKEDWDRLIRKYVK